MDTITSIGLPTRFGFLLLNDFTLISLSSAVEPLRMANRIAARIITPGRQYRKLAKLYLQVTAFLSMSIVASKVRTP